MPLRYPAERIIVQCPSWVGDAVMATPFLERLRRSYPDAQITALLRPYMRPVLADGPWFDSYLEYDPHSRAADRAGLMATARALRRCQADVFILLTHSFRAAMLAWLSGAPRRVGITRGDQRVFLTDAVAWPREGGRRLPIAKVDLYALVARHLDLTRGNDHAQRLHFTAEQDERVRTLMAAKGAEPAAPLVCLVPGAAFGPAKRWHSDRFARVGDALAERLGAAVAIIASPDEAALAGEIAGAMNTPPVVFAEGEMDLGLLKTLVARASLMVTTDTGPRHYAVALNVPVVVLMGPTDPRLTASRYERAIILRQDVPCGPCQQRVCPRDHACMDRITVAHVLDAADRLLAQWPAKPFAETGQRP